MYRSKYKHLFSPSDRIAVVKSIMVVLGTAYNKAPSDIDIMDKLKIDGSSNVFDPYEVPSDIRKQIDTVYDFIEYGFDSTYIQSQMNILLSNGKGKKGRKGKPKGE